MRALRPILALIVLTMVGLAGYNRFLKPSLLAESFAKQKQQAVGDMQFIIRQVELYYRDHGNYPDTIMQALGPTATQSANSFGISPEELRAHYIYVKPTTTNLAYNQTIVLERPGRYTYRKGAHAGEVSGAVQWLGERNMLTYLSNHAIASSTWLQKP